MDIGYYATPFEVGREASAGDGGRDGGFGARRASLDRDDSLSDATSWEQASDGAPDGDDWSSHASDATVPLPSVRATRTTHKYDTTTLVSRSELAFLDDITIENYLEHQVLIRRTIPREFVKQWNALLLPFLADMQRDSDGPAQEKFGADGKPTPATCNARLFRLFWMLPRLIWHTPARSKNTE